MANEFIIRDGFQSKFGLVVTGSLTVTAGITGSLSTASYAITAGFASTGVSASLTNNIDSSSYSIFANSASYAILGTYVSSSTINYTAPQVSPTDLASSIGSVGYLSPMYNFHNNLQAAHNNRQTNTIYLTPLLINSNCIVKKIGIPCQRTVTTVGIRLGIYTNSDLMLPETNIMDENLTPIANARVLHEVTASTVVSLKAGEIYWLATMMTGNVTQPPLAVTVNYVTTAWANTFQNSAYNRLFNPLMGLAPPSNQNAMRHISYYAFTTASTGSLQASLPQTALSYTVYSYGAKSTLAGVNNTNTFLPPVIQVSYN